MAEDILGGTDAVQGLTTQMVRLDQVTSQFGRSLSKALASGIVQGKSFDEILQSVGQRFLELSLRAAFKPLQSGISSTLGGLVNGASGLISSALGGVFGGSGGGGFGDLFGGGSGGSSAGLFGTAAPATSGVTVNMAVSTPDAESFQRSEGQISAALARAVSRGQRSL